MYYVKHILGIFIRQLYDVLLKCIFTIKIMYLFDYKLCKRFLINKIVCTPSWSSMISFPMDAKVVHLQLFIAFALHLLCILYLQTSQLKPWEVTPVTIHIIL